MKKNTRSYLTIFILFICASKTWVFGQEETHKSFKHSFTHLNQKGADDYLIEKTDIKKYSEWQNPPITYYGPSANRSEEHTSELSHTVISYAVFCLKKKKTQNKKKNKLK